MKNLTKSLISVMLVASIGTANVFACGPKCEPKRRKDPPRVEKRSGKKVETRIELGNDVIKVEPKVSVTVKPRRKPRKVTYVVEEDAVEDLAAMAIGGLITLAVIDAIVD